MGAGAGCYGTESSVVAQTHRCLVLCARRRWVQSILLMLILRLLLRSLLLLLILLMMLLLRRGGFDANFARDDDFRLAAHSEHRSARGARGEEGRQGVFARRNPMARAQNRVVQSAEGKAKAGRKHPGGSPSAPSASLAVVMHQLSRASSRQRRSETGAAAAFRHAKSGGRNGGVPATGGY